MVAVLRHEAERDEEFALVVLSRGADYGQGRVCQGSVSDGIRANCQRCLREIAYCATLIALGANSASWGISSEAICFLGAEYHQPKDQQRREKLAHLRRYLLQGDVAP